MIETEEKIDIEYTVQEQADYLENYIDTIKNKSWKSAAVIKNNILRFLRFIGKDIDYFQLKMSDGDKYLKWVNEHLNKHSYKKTIRSNLHSYFKWLHKHYKVENIIDDEYTFKHDTALTIREKDKKKQLKLFTIEQLKNGLIRAFQLNSFTFILIALLVFTGARISEIISIKRDDIILEKLYFETGKEDGARKSNRDTENPLAFCILEELSNHLFNYLQELKITHPDGEWLFEGQNGEHFGDRSATKVIRKIMGTEKSHMFRDTIQTFQQNTINMVNPYLCDLLVCRKIQSTAAKFYDLSTVEKRKILYKKCMPKEYEPLIELLTNL